MDNEKLREAVEKLVSKAYWYDGQKNIVVDITKKILALWPKVLSKETRKAIRDKVYPWDEAVPMNENLGELLDKIQVETSQATVDKNKGE